MPKIEVKSNWRVEVFPRNVGDLGFIRISAGGLIDERSEKETIRICESIAEKIKKHVGKFDDDRGEVIVTCDTDHVCSHCGWKWTETTPHNGGCCHEDGIAMEEYEKQNPPEPKLELSGYHLDELKRQIAVAKEMIKTDDTEQVTRQGSNYTPHAWRTVLRNIIRSIGDV